MQKLTQSPLKNFIYFLFCGGSSYAMIELMRHVYGLLEQSKNASAVGGGDWLISIAQYMIGSFGAALAIAVIFTVVEIWATGRKRRVSNYSLSFANLLLSFALFAVALYFLQSGLTRMGVEPLLDFKSQQLSIIPTYCVILAYFFVVDVLLYWVHRLEHTNKLLWYLHAIHHAEEDLDSASSAFHPLSNLYRWMLTILPLKFLVAVNYADVLILASFMIGVHFFQHTRAPFHFGWFGKVIGDNRFHFVHHSKNPVHFNKNYAAHFPVIDMMFGTYLNPDDKHLPETGLPDRHGAATVGQFLSGALKDK